MSVQVIGCLSATVLYLCFFYGFEAAVSAPCGRVANASLSQPRSEGAGHKKCFMDSKGDGKHFFWLVFLACLSSACCGVWPFRIRCPRASFLCLCRL